VFDRLKQKWGVDQWALVWILITFAVGGSLCGYLAKKILPFFGLEAGVVKVIVYILLVTVLWPICVLVISLITGQFRFFRSYLQRIGKRMTGRSKT
jgi:hypothetical protein